MPLQTLYHASPPLLFISLHSFLLMSQLHQTNQKFVIIIISIRHFFHCKLSQSPKSRSMTSGKQIQNEILRNTVAEMLRQKWTNWRRKSGQTGGAARLALATIWNDLPKFLRCPGLLHVPQNPNMCAMWGGTSHIFSARSPWSKITRSEGVRSSNWLSSQLENLTTSDIIPDPLPSWLKLITNVDSRDASASKNIHKN